MGPKKAKGKMMDSVDGVDTSKMSREQLELYSHKILEEMEREREERNFFQLERDKLRTFWEITRHQLDEARAAIRNKEREKEELMEKHEAEIKLYKQKIKHLMYEHETNLSETKAEHMVALKISQDNHNDEERQLIKDKSDLRKIQKNQELTCINEIRDVKLKNAQETSALMKKFQCEAMELEKKYEEKLMTQYESLILKHRMEITEVEERKNIQISNLIKEHEKAFASIKSYYNDITLNNLSLMQSLKVIFTEIPCQLICQRLYLFSAIAQSLFALFQNQMEIMKNNEERMKKQVRESVTENKKLCINLKECEEHVADLIRQLTNYEKDKSCLINTKRRLASISKDYENLKWENEVLELRFEKCQDERDELHSRFVSSILELQQKTSLKNVLLEKKLEKLSDLMDQREVQMNQVLDEVSLANSTAITAE
ncbi:dynein regulatory complex subunit 4 isoform X1 [Diachasma alloeum]|uniref:dynein regulatory complex subunit 4 isoform X1 n=1 Tax=Diachasma alloeum TaxID=454923 RepID=UPI00073811FC|nr:dynein regulatory complex subunit 4 isoform X1 [Diachasma alloeum]